MVLESIIFILHILFILLILLSPFSNNLQLLTLSIILIPFLFFHWLTNNNVCILTEIEKNLRDFKDKKEEKENSFTYNLLNPIFTFNNNKTNIIIYSLLIILFTISISKIFYGYESGQLNRIFDLFTVYKLK